MQFFAPHGSCATVIFRKQGQGELSGSEVGVRIRTPDPDSGPDFIQNLTRTSLSKAISVIKFSWKSDHSLRRYKPNCDKFALCRSVKESFRKLLDPILNSDEWLPNSDQFFLVYRHISGNNYREEPFSIFYVKLLTEKRQTLHNVLGGRNDELTDDKLFTMKCT